MEDILSKDNYELLLHTNYEKQGGFQQLLGKLKNQLYTREIQMQNGSNQIIYLISLSDEDIEKIIRYANYRRGGPQSILQKVFPDLV